MQNVSLSWSQLFFRVYLADVSQSTLAPQHCVTAEGMDHEKEGERKGEERGGERGV